MKTKQVRQLLLATILCCFGVKGYSQNSRAACASAPQMVTEEVYWTNDNLEVSSFDPSNNQTNSVTPAGIFDTWGAAVHHEGIDKTYFVANNVIYSMDGNGANVTAIIAGVDTLTDLALDPDNNYIYYSERLDQVVTRMNLDGSNPVNVLHSRPFTGIYLDRFNQHIYWVDDNGVLGRNNVDGTVEIVYSGSANDVTDLAFDHLRDNMYWALSTGDIWRYNTAGGGTSIFRTGLGDVFGIDVDPINGRIYHTGSTQSIYVVDLNGVPQSSTSSVGPGAQYINLAQVPLQGTPVTACGSYTSPSGNDVWTTSGVYLDILPGAGAGGCDSSVVIDLTISPAPTLPQYTNEKLYWFNTNGLGQLMTVNTDGTGLSPGPAGTGLGTGIAFDATADKFFIYGSGQITSVNGDGTNLTTIITGETGTRDMVVDPDNGYIYYSNFGGGTIKRANQDGSGVTTILSGIAPLGLYLDRVNHQIYWADLGTGNIRKANLDGTGVTTIATGQSDCRDVAYSDVTDEVFWTRGNQSAIFTGSDATGVSTLISGLSDVYGMEIDPDQGEIYYCQAGSSLIGKCNVDGSSPTTLASGQSGLVYMAIGQNAMNSSSASACGSYTSATGNQIWTTSGVYRDTLTTAGGCDSIIFVDLTINQPTSSTQTLVECQGFSVTVGSNTYNTTGIYTDVLTDVNGCDSTVTTDLTINQPTSSSQTFVECQGFSVTVGSNTYNTTGVYTDVLTDVNGCDSTVTTDLTINQPTSSSQTFVECQGFSVTVGSNTYNTTGVYTDVLTDVNGCDSTVTTDLTINQPTSSSQTFVECQGFSVTVGSNTYNTTGVYTDVLTDVNGCDSTVTTDLTINQPTSSSQTFVECQGFSVTVGSNTYNTSGVYTDVLTDVNGCDSTVTTDLTINQPTSSSQTFVECQGFSVTVGSNTYNTTGVYTDVLTDVNGCNSTVTTNLTINQPTSSSQTFVECQGFSVTVGSNTYNTTGVYTDVLTGANGCDSTVTTDLTINQPTSSSQSFVECQGFSVTVGSNTYNTTGVYTDVLTDVNGCDSTITTDLTINQPTSSSQTFVECQGFSVTVGSNTYNTTGVYTDVLTDVNGCDSTVTTDLTINQPTSSSQTLIECQGFSVTVGSNTYNTTGVYTDVLTGANGCDSTVTTDLTINQPTSSSQTFVECQGFSVTVGSNTYNTTGIYTDVLTGANGCDSTVTTDLTIEPAINVATTLTGITISADETGAIYQWIDCDNGNQQISGETNQSFTPAQDGNYAVIVTVGNCSDTSACTNVIGVGIENSDWRPSLSVYPNPVNDQLTIEVGAAQEVLQIELFSAQGQLVQSATTMNDQLILLDLNELSTGIYYLRVRGEHYSSTIPVSKR